MKQLFCWALLVVFTLSPVSLAADSAPLRPNIILVLADDVGIGDVSCYGADHFKTPNVDLLATQGTRYTHCYAAPLCGPSRCLILTGRYAFRTGMTGNDTGPTIKPKNEVMIPTVLRAAGYATGQCGKWSQLPLAPSDFGFQEYLRFQGSGDYWNTQQRAKIYFIDGKPVSLADGAYLPDKMHEYVCDFLTRHQHEPFFLYYPMSHVHSDILPTPDSAKDSKDLYADNVAYMDKLVGKLMAKLDELKLRDNTLVIFVGDNGTAPPAYQNSSVNGKTLVGHKGTMEECGSLVPMVAVWPNHIPAGKISDQLIDFTDYLPTFAELAGAPLPKGVTIDGKSFASQLEGKEGPQRDWIFIEIGKHWYARSAQYKLDEANNLFDMSGSPFEEKPVPAGSGDEKASAARKQLQLVLDTLSPATGKTDPGDGTGRGAAARKAAAASAAAAARIAVWDSLDTDKAGKLTKDQFTTKRSDLPNAGVRFGKMDTNHDGFLSREEFLKAGIAAK